MVINKKLFLISTIIPLVASLGVISATDTSNKDISTNKISLDEQTNPNTIEQEKTQKTNTIQETPKKINKTETRNTKTSNPKSTII